MLLRSRGCYYLCEILECDELQISGEISIWNAALRWADSKCRKNGIECSAENRRQMLGPALFKIRFPLFSQKEFSEKIIPFGVLSKDELIAVYQFHALPNCHGISDELFPMPFTIIGRISDRTNGTLLMDIKKVSEFAREKVLSSRHSEKVYINGLPWKIQAEIEKKMESTDNNEKCLGIYLLCDAPEEDSNWRCYVRSATFRIVSQNNGAENSIGTIYDLVFDSKLNNCGFGNFISFAELMCPSKEFYIREEDKVTLAIDVTMKDEKTEKFILDQSKSRGILLMEIEKVTEFAREVIGSERKSEPVRIKGFPWKIWAEIEKNDESIDNKKWLGIYLLCNAPKEDKNWSCKCSATFRIVSQKNDVLDCKQEFNDCFFDNTKNHGGYANFISFAELINPSKGFYDKSEDKVTLGWPLMSQ